MSAAETDPINGLPIDYFVEDSRVLDAGAFTARYGNGFLVHEGPLEPARRPMRPQRTIVLEPGALPATLDPDGTKPTEPTRPLFVRELLVFPIVSTGRSPFPRMVTVGRTKNNDIVVADVAISKFHAFFKEEGGRFYLQDAGSRNGTRLNGEQVPEAKHGKHVEATSGSAIRLGEIEFTFMSGADLYALANKRLR